MSFPVEGKRPCQCNRCHLCHLYHTDPNYREFWGGPGQGPAAPDGRGAPAPCARRGAEAGETLCPGCKGNVRVKLFSCSLHGKCSLARPVAGAALCQGCADYESPCHWLIPGVPDPLPEPEVLPVPKGWPSRPDVRDRHIAAFRKLLETDFPPPEKAKGRGVITLGGGKYWPMVRASLRMLRDVSDLPVQVWHRGEEEPVYPEEVAGLGGITFHDTTALAPRPRVVRGWESKTVALLHCGWAQALYLDADAYLVGDPSYLLEDAARYGLVYWHDLFDFWVRTRWEWFGVEEMAGQKVPPIQGGQFAIDLVKMRRQLVLAHWWAQHSDYSMDPGKGYSDQECWRVALAATGCGQDDGFDCLGKAPWVWPAFVCPLPDGTPAVVHRPQGKAWGRGDDRRTSHLPGDERWWDYLGRTSLAPAGGPKPSTP